MNLINKQSLLEVLRPLELEAVIHAPEDDINRQAAILTATTNYAVDVGTIEVTTNLEEDPALLETVARDVVSGIVILHLAGEAGEDAVRGAVADYVAAWETDTAHESLAVAAARNDSDGEYSDDDND